MGVGWASGALSDAAVATDVSAFAGAAELSSVIALTPPNEPGLTQIN
jgi:hypothetical protein